LGFIKKEMILDGGILQKESSEDTDDSELKLRILFLRLKKKYEFINLIFIRLGINFELFVF